MLPLRMSLHTLRSHVSGDDPLGVDSIIPSLDEDDLSAPKIVLYQSNDGPFIPVIYVLGALLFLRQNCMLSVQ